MDKAIDRLAGMIEGGYLLAATDSAMFLHVCADRIKELEHQLSELHTIAQDIYNEKGTSFDRLARQEDLKLMITQENYRELSKVLMRAEQALEKE